MIVLADASGACKIVHYGCNGCRRFPSSVMAAEVHVLVLGFGYAYVIRSFLNELIGQEVSLEAYYDSKTLFNVVAKDGETTERRLQFFVIALHESYERGLLSHIGWIPGPSNVADALTKPVLSKVLPLFAMMTENAISLLAKH